MSKPRFKWWGYIKAVIRNYPAHHEELYNSKLQSVTASWSDMPRGGNIGRGVERYALRQLPADDQKEYDAVYQAARETMNAHFNGEERLRLIDMVFWRRTHTLHGAADVLHVSYATAKSWHNDFIVLVAKKMDIHHPISKV